jgi:hypothetical protein
MDELMHMILTEPGVHTYAHAEPSFVHFETPEAPAQAAVAARPPSRPEPPSMPEPAVDPAAVDPAAGGEPTDAELEGAGLSREDYLQLAREGAGEAFREMLAEAERQEIQAREQAGRASSARSRRTSSRPGIPSTPRS